MRKGARLVIQGVILGSILVGSLCYFVSAGATPLPDQQPAVQNSQELISSPTQPVNQENEPTAQPVGQESNSQNQPALAASAAPDPTATQPAKKQPAKAKKQKPKCQVSDRYPESIRQWCGLITKYTGKYKLDPNLIAAVMLQESGGNPDAYSPSGAVGLLQVMPNDGLAAGFTCPSGPCFANRPSMKELQDPEFNIDYGTRMLASLVDKHGNLQDALKAYGPGNSGYYYANKVLAIYHNYQ
jgi:soluble lytic murein transglycosylase-like protein